MVKIKIGHIHRVLFEKEGVGGYTWQMANKAPQRGIVVEKCEEQPTPSVVPGAAANIFYCIKALSAGNYKVIFEMRRSWENNEPPIKTKMIEVTVE